MCFILFAALVWLVYTNRKLKKRNAQLESDLKGSERTISMLNKLLASERQPRPKAEPLRGIKVSSNFQRTGSDV